MIKESNLIGLPILSYNFEPLNYVVKEIIYCLVKFRVLALCVGSIDSEKHTQIILFQKIKDITEKGVLIYSTDDIVKTDEIPEFKNIIENYKPVTGYEIYLNNNNNNEIIGVVKDTLIQIKSGKILGFIMSEGLFDDLINGYSFLPISNEINLEEQKIILDNKKELKILPQQGGLKKMLGIDKQN